MEMTELELILMVLHYSLIPELLVEACLLHMDLKFDCCEYIRIYRPQTSNTKSRLDVRWVESSWVCQAS